MRNAYVTGSRFITSEGAKARRLTMQNNPYAEPIWQYPPAQPYAASLLSWQFVAYCRSEEFGNTFTGVYRTPEYARSYTFQFIDA